MDQSNSELKYSKVVKLLSWSLMIGSVLILLKLLFMNNGYLNIYNKYLITKNFDPPSDFNFTTFLIFVILETLLCTLVFISSTNVLKHKEQWRKISIYTLVASIIVSFISPKLMVYPYLWSVFLTMAIIPIIVFLS